MGAPGRREAPRVAVESQAIWAGTAAAAVSVLVGLIGFHGRRPALAGDGSVAFYASILAGLAVAGAFLAGYLQHARAVHAWLGARPALRQAVDVAALMVVHASIAVMSALVVFRLFQEAFFGLTVDTIAGTAMLAIAAGIAGYTGFTSGAQLTTASLSVLLAVFMASGMLVSMIFAENPLWWHSMFSELGTGQAGTTSFWTFNTTITVSGIILTTLAAFITRDLRQWTGLLDARDAAAGRKRRRVVRPRPSVVRVCLLASGICMAGIGLFPVNLFDPVHSFFVRALAAILLVLLLGAPVWLPGFPRAFYFISVVAVAGLAAAAYLWAPLGYYNLTAFELAAAGIVFAWLVVFIRTTTAVVASAGLDPARLGEALPEPGSGVVPGNDAGASLPGQVRP
ncbi:hypothetical protein ACQ7DA_06245 [Zafaria sp. J156]|uniref:hypothetical protein n=1 Tax=Zafaria sp. J156 TaxID=3116490 RepID=UPI002E7A20AF|nr:hypothetical protein [Zafaria sp. J156]MEE1621028.1 hypothetical protein [Zafaria sp. J156]